MSDTSGSQPQSGPVKRDAPPAAPVASGDEIGGMELKKREAEALLRMLDDEIARKRRERSSDRRGGGISTARIVAILLLVALLFGSWFALTTLTELNTSRALSSDDAPGAGQ